jgi:hypothetical protein
MPNLISCEESEIEVGAENSGQVWYEGIVGVHGKHEGRERALREPEAQEGLGSVL